MVSSSCSGFRFICCSSDYFGSFCFDFQWSRQLAESGAHVVMAVRNPKAALDLIQKWQNEWSGKGLPLNIEVSKIHSSSV